ncbi:CehA/McbA family metallohydrolase [Alicyclobacillus macrosporangiidus]|uniref:CehA/McbA family metallohydrolase n=1 Tax=Alicyclobacillus macrosporangiidus TaxID=392015 RepID=UPI0006908ECE|nr:CehA/McbA family metallohydrolase [Alicyclobacillus macrosporangiidus]
METEPLYHTLTLKRHIEPSEQGLFLEVPFQMPEGADDLTVRIEVAATPGASAVIDLGVRDSHRVRGWSGGARRHFTIGLDQATPGYLPGPIAPGEWAVLLGAYQVPDEGCDVTLSIRCALRSPRWLKGDLHGHTVHSDGQYTLAQVVEIVESLGLDFMGLMDHNTCSQNRTYPRDTSVVFIPGMELTTYRGHCNLLGVPDPVDDFRVVDQAMLNERIAEARSRGAYVSLNHPCDTSCPSCSWQWDWQFPYDWVEIWNGPWRECNQQALAWWQRQLASGARVVAVGGSDVHRPHPLVRHGWPTTWVKAESRSIVGILQALKAGHAFISYAPDGPAAELSCGDFMMGDVVPHDQRAPFELTLQGVQEGDTVCVISDQGNEITRVIEAGATDFSLTWPAAGRRFYRVEVWRHFDAVGQRLPALITNPIYLG